MSNLSYQDKVQYIKDQTGASAEAIGVRLGGIAGNAVRYWLSGKVTNPAPRSRNSINRLYNKLKKEE